MLKTYLLWKIFRLMTSRRARKKLLIILLAIGMFIYARTSPEFSQAPSTTAAGPVWDIAEERSGVYEEPTAGEKEEEGADAPLVDSAAAISLENIPPYSGTVAITLNNNVPLFTATEHTTDPFESYSELDALGRCGTAYANICKELMPTEKRGEIGHIKPSGWHSVKYPEVISDLYLYNRCHLIGFQLAGENDNVRNLITGTRYFNVDGMLPYENMVDEYVDSTGNHVLYRVTPMYEGNNLVAAGVRMEAWSVEDGGKGLRFHVFVYNIQPGIEIDYATGESRLAAEVWSPN